jgi:hypothetical protein
MANTRNKFDKKDSLELGEKAENLFILLAVRMGWKVSASSNHENIHDHWDYLIERKTESYKVEVKSKKRLRRNEDTPQQNFIWVELKNVRGELGWLFGKADLIAFEREKNFLIIQKNDLKKMVKEKVDLKSKAKNANDALYKIYQREGRKDKLTLLPIKDIEEIKFMEWAKE